MTNLAKSLRPLVEFEVDNKQHRQWYAEFRSTRSWKNCPVRFAVAKPALTVVSMIEQQLLDYYLAQEVWTK